MRRAGVPAEFLAPRSKPEIAIEEIDRLRAAGLLRGWVRDEPLPQALRYANACGAIVVSRHGCAPAMPPAAAPSSRISRRASPMSPRALCVGMGPTFWPAAL